MSTDTEIGVAACIRLGKHKYTVNAMLRCEDTKPEALDITCICKNVKRSARGYQVKTQRRRDSRKIMMGVRKLT